MLLQSPPAFGNIRRPTPVAPQPRRAPYPDPRNSDPNYRPAMSLLGQANVGAGNTAPPPGAGDGGALQLPTVRGVAGGATGLGASLVALQDYANKQKAQRDQAMIAEEAQRKVQEASDAARKANEDRYNSILDSNSAAKAAISSRFDQARQSLARYGVGQRADIAKRFGDAGGAIDEAAITAGRFNTSIRDRDRTINNESQQRANLDLEDRLSARDVDLTLAQGNAEAQFDRDAMGVMERRTDVGPNLGLYADLIKQSAAAQGGNFGGLVSAAAPQAGAGAGAGGIGDLGANWLFGRDPNRIGVGGGTIQPVRDTGPIGGNPDQTSDEIDSLYRQGRISPEEYDRRRAALGKRRSPPNRPR